MEEEFMKFLRERKVKPGVLAKLEEEDITSKVIFMSLKKEELKLLFERGISVGQYSTLSRAWEEVASEETERRSPKKKMPASPKRASSDPKSRQELFQKYKVSMQKIREEKGNSAAIVKKKHVAIQFGGMVYNEKLEKGVKRKGFAPPRMIDFDVCSTYCEVLQQTKEIFFPNETDNAECYSLAGTSGIPFEVKEEDWVLGDFLKTHGFQPSKLRLYILFDPRNDFQDNDCEAESQSPAVPKTPPRLAPPLKAVQPSVQSESPPRKHSYTRRTKPVEQNCVLCGLPFLAPIENTICDLPDGNVVAFAEPVLECPCCDIDQFGMSYNEEFFKKRGLHNEYFVD